MDRLVGGSAHLGLLEQRSERRHPGFVPIALLQSAVSGLCELPASRDTAVCGEEGLNPLETLNAARAALLAELSH